MRTIYSLCLLLLICKLSIGESIKPKSIQIEPCAFCNLVVGSLQEVLKNEVNRESIFQQMDKICGAVAQFVPKEQCNAFVSVYGRYILQAIDTATAVTNPEYLCQEVLQFCPRSGEDSPFYQPLLPMNADDSYQITWNALETGFANRAFYYKVFLPETDLVSGSAPILNVYLSSIVGANINLQVSQEDYANNLDCSEDTFCNMDIQYPPVNQWYYFIVTASEVSEPDTQFSLSVTKYNLLGGEVDGEPGSFGDDTHTRVHRHFIPIFPLLVLAAVCCCCCAARRRKQVKKQQEQQIAPVQQQHEVVNLEAFPEQQAPPPGYFYYPPQNMVYVPQGYMPMHPVSAPPATNENMNN